MSYLKTKTPRIREKRLDTLNAWLGPAKSAVGEFAGDEAVQRIRTFSQSTNDDVLHALRILSRIENSVTVIHAPRGCAAGALYHKLALGQGNWLVTNLDQKDTIMGADRKLRKAVTSAHRTYRPEVLFILSSPVAAINNDDIQAVVDELQDELELPVIPVFVTGFASRNAVTGYDIVLHSILRQLVRGREAGERNGRVNLLSVTEHRADIQEITRLLTALGLELNILPDHATPGSFVQATGARLSLSLNQDAENYLGTVLRDEYGVPYQAPGRPVGIEATGQWLVAAGKAAGLEQAAAELHRQESARIGRELGDFSLSGVRVYLSLPPGMAFSVASLVEEFGGEIAGITVSHLDVLHKARLEDIASRHPSLQIHVADGQPFEELNILRRIGPDLYIGDGNHLGQVGRLGIPVVSLEHSRLLGYDGTLILCRRISVVLKNRSFGQRLASVALPYKESWLQRSPNWHIKKEVK
ncbi:MAG: nitrogenase molybdenum-iron protein [Chlorobiaceae bacterium]|nr:nitrogenase molybdenum-iron protein [Chlorobiaceae bacterium]